jgi:hypothetical protein
MMPLLKKGREAMLLHNLLVLESLFFSYAQTAKCHRHRYKINSLTCVGGFNNIMPEVIQQKPKLLGHIRLSHNHDSRRADRLWKTWS